MTSVPLEINRSLLDNKFEGYKLSLDSIPVLKSTINGDVEPFEPSLEEYSLMHVHMSSHVNQLFLDMWSPSCTFFISQKKLIHWCCLMQDGRLSPSRVVWHFPVTPNQLKNNASILFPDPEWAIFSDGQGTIYILNTPSRNVGEPWVLCHTYTTDCASSCYLLYSIHRSLPNRHQIDLVLAHFSTPLKEIEEKDVRTPPFTCIVDWLSFICSDDTLNWSLKRNRRLAGNSPLLYVALETGCDAIYIASETKFKFIFDSEKPCSIIKPSENGKVLKDNPLYTYLQTPEDITVVFQLPQSITKENISVKFELSHLEVSWDGNTILKGDLTENIDCLASTWIVSEQKLELILSKKNVGLFWKGLIKDNDQGEEIVDPAWAAEIHSRLEHLTSENEVQAENAMPFNINELEQCDTCDENVTLIRMDGNTHDDTHLVHMGGRQWIFSSQYNPELYPVICLRHDVDGIIWQPKNISSEGGLDPFKIEHVSTFSALGYVQASKQDKRFVTCSPDFKYAVISDCTCHVYIYCQPENLDSSLELRNRKTGQSVLHIAKSYCIRLENCTKILGLQATNECIFVLSSRTLYAIIMSRK